MRRLRATGVLRSDSLVAHCVHVDASDAAVLRDSAVTIAHNPRSNMNNGVGRAPVAWLGQRVALGTDGIGSDMWEEGRVAYLRRREESLDTSPAWPTERLAAGAAFCGSAFGEPLLGRIVPGAPADLVVLDYRAPTSLDASSLAAHWIYGLSSAIVRDVIVAGELVVRDRRLTRVDELELSARAREESPTSVAADGRGRRPPVRPQGGAGRDRRRLMADLSTVICGLRFANPVLPAAGPPGRDGAALLACAKGGAGGLVAKTISTQPAQPPTPNMAEISQGMVNTELWSELPPEQWIETEYTLARTAGLPLIVSLGYTADEISELAPRIKPFADAVELSTHYIGEDPEPMVAAVRAAKAALDVPVLVKLSPHAHDMAVAARLAADAGADGIVAINSFGPVLSIDIETALPRLGGPNGYGWISGPALKPLAVRCVREIARAVDLPIVGVGGVSRGTDAVEMLMAGATAVGVCTAAILRGPSVFGKIAAELDEWLTSHGYESTKEIVGLAITRAWPAGPLPAPVVNNEACNTCGICVTACVYGAIHVVDGRIALDGEKCTRCGLCVTRCRLAAIDWPALQPEAARPG